jgi:hypothetical protein
LRLTVVGRGGVGVVGTCMRGVEGGEKVGVGLG